MDLTLQRHTLTLSAALALGAVAVSAAPRLWIIAAAGLRVAEARARAVGVLGAGGFAVTRHADRHPWAVQIGGAHPRRHAQPAVAALRAGAGLVVGAGPLAGALNTESIAVAVLGHEAGGGLGAQAGVEVAGSGPRAVRVLGAGRRAGAPSAEPGPNAVVIGLAHGGVAAGAIWGAHLRAWARVGLGAVIHADVLSAVPIRVTVGVDEAGVRLAAAARSAIADARSRAARVL